MDALDRLEPVARELVHRADEYLAQQGAPADHPVWTLLRRVGAVPSDAVCFVAGQRPDRLRHLGDAIREHTAGYHAASIPTALDWAGSAGTAYAAQAAALAAHQGGDGPDSLAGRLVETAGYLDAVADWQQGTRDQLARALADILTSAQAVVVRLGSDGARPVGPSEGSAGASGRAVALAAADIGARILEVAARALEVGADIGPAWADRLTELSYVEPIEAGPARAGQTIDVRP